MGTFAISDYMKGINYVSVQPLPGSVMHSYILPGAAWEVPAQRGAVVDSIPFTHPAHVPALLELLRHQCVINTLLRSCMTSQCTGTGNTKFGWYWLIKTSTPIKRGRN